MIFHTTALPPRLAFQFINHGRIAWAAPTYSTLDHSPPRPPPPAPRPPFVPDENPLAVSRGHVAVVLLRVLSLGLCCLLRSARGCADGRRRRSDHVYPRRTSHLWFREFLHPDNRRVGMGRGRSSSTTITIHEKIFIF